ncbi:spider silk-constituting element SpiCE-CMa6 [Caerostris darwini]|uniref:Spider silk-constituting element SpiCE-CMa6 n=1 Tax=Caerostris darwini TaxID=1538125 RepID=A0AAV4X740_9ARAC|nr:spider silk-constituting element SpiCE-CMa6 [Caerostris darwini]
MKAIVLSFAAIVVVSLMVLNVEGSSMPKCGDCDQSNCPSVNCECGTKKDVCQCCDYCLKCPGESCSLLRSESCSEGHTCYYPPGMDYVARLANDGTCTRDEESPAQ